MRKNKLAIISNESDLCMNITHSNSTVGLDLFFPNNIHELNNVDANIVVVDLNDQTISAFNINKSSFILIGVINRLNKHIERKARESGYDIIFTKSMLIKNYKTIINQILNA